MSKISPVINLLGQERKFTVYTKADKAKALHQDSEKVIGDKI